MITAIITIIAAILFVSGLYLAIEYRQQYCARMDRYQVEEEFVQDYLQTQEALKLVTYIDGNSLISSFKERWAEIIERERVDYFVEQMHKSLDLRVLYQVNAN
jgi:hypothetical protein